MSKTVYLTTPLYYVNAAPHIGHSYTNIAADCLARYHRLKGEQVFLLTGTDEHGQKIEQAAAAAGQTPSVFVDQVVERFTALWKALPCSPCLTEANYRSSRCRIHSCMSAIATGEATAALDRILLASVPAEEGSPWPDASRD